MALLVGTSGWQYRDWRGAFYPRDLAQAHWLGHYADRFAVVEVNNTFYRLPERSTFEDWAAGSPDDFVFVLKASRYLTHVKRLKDPAEPVRRFVDHAGGLGPKLGPVLLQLPPTLEAEPGRLRDALDRFPRDVRVAVEPRHDSWFVDEVLEVLADHDAALCLVDWQYRRPPLHRTARWGYVRLHGGRARPAPCYGKQALTWWVERIAERFDPDDDVFVFFNNDTHACAVRDATVLARLAARHGLRPTRTPAPRDVEVGAAGLPSPP